MLDSVGLVHMNGRVYDPLIGRFLSADPIIQTISMSQAINPYSYVMNIPLALIDPSGYSWLSHLVSSVGNLFKQAAHSATFRFILSIAIVVALPYMAPGLFQGFAGQVLLGAIQQGIASGNLRGAGNGAISTALSNEVGVPIKVSPLSSKHASATSTEEAHSASKRIDFSQPRFTILDRIIYQEVDRYNSDNGYSLLDDEYLDPDLIRAIVAVESGPFGRVYENDPMQVNNTGDWDTAKGTVAGLTRGQAPGPIVGIRAGIAWLRYKAYIHNKAGVSVRFRGWTSAVSRYNAGGDAYYLSKVETTWAGITLEYAQ
jgi:RHS repeat-associated protein